jgi:beta-lactamase regulating signal transducer with metallopeptidase domain
VIELMTVASIAIKTILVVVAAGLLSVALRRQSAAFHHVLWTSALALCVLMPLAVVFLPSHDVVVLPAAQTTMVRSAAPSGSVVIALLLIGSAIVLIRELLATIGLARWRRQAQGASTHWSATLARISAAHGFDVRGLRVVESEDIASPCTWGVLRPILLLPSAGNAWPESARYAALVHELAHIQRRDALSTLISRLACVLHWYNPLVWLAARHVRSLQERACDDAVLCAGAVPSDYAQFLLDVAADTSGMPRPARMAIGMAHGSSLRMRIVAILDPRASRSPPQRAHLIAACTSLLMVTILLATTSVAVEPPPLPKIPSLPEIPLLPKLPLTPVTPVQGLQPVQAVPAVPPVQAIPPQLSVPARQL